MPIINYYDILEVPPTATQEEIKDAYRLMISMMHPDKFTEGSKQQQKATEKTKIANEAFSVLNDPHKRAQYDALIGQQQPGQKGMGERHYQEAARGQSVQQAAPSTSIGGCLITIIGIMVVLGMLQVALRALAAIPISVMILGAFIALIVYFTGKK